MNKKAKNGDGTQCTSICQQVEVPTKDELTALDALRSIKEKVRKAKQELSVALSTDDVETAGRVEAELAQLKEEWDRWHARKEEAARNRMILLGHLES